MIISVLWEDQQGVNAKGFGPHELLVSCLADELLESNIADEFQRARVLVKKYVQSRARKGNSKVIRDLQQAASRSSTGPLCAVIDLDKVRELWPGEKRPPACFSGIRAAVFDKARGNYELVLLDKNMETLLSACCEATGSIMPRPKPAPDERDQILEKLAWLDAKARGEVRTAVPSFNRLIGWVADRLRPIINRRRNQYR